MNGVVVLVGSVVTTVGVGGGVVEVDLVHTYNGSALLVTRTDSACVATWNVSAMVLMVWRRRMSLIGLLTLFCTYHL